ncbi:hypothetical protein [Pseudobutyrivibrio xylanivorans]|uniref:Uncharacterized protein n=1 Tax=Pseudobutyrivibrio xylanivorans DSM 14809 TaxID=1123012 RepID=A0A1M6JW84_PSEXY|nr:hypothetical protein [Pseudobutyrivibrio xylanivorans]SHJ50971.1 hypothetical protein SAMN02745725_02706 [Pseudobutyrivibrio xylanivorans DSM 14809]
MKDDVIPLEYHPGIFDKYKNNTNLDDWCDGFPDVMCGLGFDMDAGESFLAFKESCGLHIKPANNRRNEYRNILYLLEHAERQIIGNYLFSEWRYFTHWSLGGYDEYDSDLCIRILNLLESTYIEKE